MQRKDLSMSNIFSLHQELQNATEQYEQYLLLEDFVMSELWYRQMELITEEMKSTICREKLFLFEEITHNCNRLLTSSHNSFGCI